jgi:DNA-directed RNA polymerase specialized sigma24 family protein
MADAIPSAVIASTRVGSFAPAPVPSKTRFRSRRGANALEQHRPFVWRVLRRLGLSRGEATRALDEVFGALGDEPRFARPAQLSILAGAAVRVAGQRRRNSARPPVLEAEPFDAEALPGEEARALRDSLLLIDGALSALDTAERAAFVLIELEGMTLDQLAAALEMSPRMASAQLNQARVKFDLAARRLIEASERRARA